MDRGRYLRIALAPVAWMALSVVALADDWVVDRLRGEAQVRIDGSWLPLQRGDVVSDDSPVRSLEGSRVTFTRGAEAIELSGATEIRIFDQQGQRMTTVMQAYGTVTVEAERLQIQHFSIQTPYLAAIVKGTRFTVHSDDTQSSVDVSRGLVQVQDYVHGVATDITPGQSATVSQDVVLDVVGLGRHAPVVTLDGHPVVPADVGSSAGAGAGNAWGRDGMQPGPANSGHSPNGNANANGHNGNGNSGSNNGGGNGNGGAGNGGGGAGSNGNGGGHGNGGGQGSGGGQGNSGQGNSGEGNSANHGNGPNAAGRPN